MKLGFVNSLVFRLTVHIKFDNFVVCLKIENYEICLWSIN